jgi:hypothetical protein
MKIAGLMGTNLETVRDGDTLGGASKKMPGNVTTTDRLKHLGEIETE